MLQLHRTLIELVVQMTMKFLIFGLYKLFCSRMKLQ